ncbi:hypothetical protein ACJMK2_015760 [Sinanodonta woodiana]|uniref:Proline-rich transmembrane protein 3/4 domain-containing protein n=1 Tax=Sinanodonta woodiana TaxID=1069815 RepID=A0ABD3UUN4_SINWO
MGLIVVIVTLISILSMTLNSGYGQDILKLQDREIYSKRDNSRMIHESIQFQKYPPKKKLPVVTKESGFLHKKSDILNNFFQRDKMKQLLNGDLHREKVVQFSAYLSAKGIFKEEPSKIQVLHGLIEPVQRKRFIRDAINHKKRDVIDLHQLVAKENDSVPNDIVFQDVNKTGHLFYHVANISNKDQTLHFIEASATQSKLDTKLLVSSSHFTTFTITPSVSASTSKLCTSVLSDSVSVTFTSSIENINSGTLNLFIGNLYSAAFISSYADFNSITSSIIDSNLDKVITPRCDGDLDTITSFFGVSSLEASASSLENLVPFTGTSSVRYLSDSSFTSSQFSKAVDGDFIVELRESHVHIFSGIPYFVSSAINASPSSTNEFGTSRGSEKNLQNMKTKSIYSCQNCVFQIESSGSHFSTYLEMQTTSILAVPTNMLIHSIPEIQQLAAENHPSSVLYDTDSKFDEYIYHNSSSLKQNGTDVFYGQVESVYSSDHNRIFSPFSVSSEDFFHQMNSLGHKFTYRNITSDSLSVSSKSTDFRNVKIASSEAITELSEISESKPEVFITTSFSSVGYIHNAFDSSSAGIDLFQTHHFRPTMLASSRTTQSSLASSTSPEAIDTMSSMDLPTPELLATEYVLTSKPIQLALSSESKISMSVLLTSSSGTSTQTEIYKPNDSSNRLILNASETTELSSIFEITSEVLDSSRTSEWEQSSPKPGSPNPEPQPDEFTGIPEPESSVTEKPYLKDTKPTGIPELELPTPEPQPKLKSTKFTGTPEPEAQSSMNEKPSLKDTKPIGIIEPEPETPTPEFSKPTSDPAEAKKTYEQQNPTSEPNKYSAEPHIPEPTQNSENPKPNTFNVQPEVLPPSSEPETKSPTSEPEGHPPSSEPETKSPTSEPEGESPSSEPETKSPTSESEGESPSSEPETKSPKTSEPEGESPSSEPETKSPTSEPEGGSPSSEPETKSPTSEPEGESPSSEPETKSPTSELEGESPSSEPHSEPSTTKTKEDLPAFTESEPEPNPKTIETHSKPPTSEPEYQPPASEPGHHSPEPEGEPETFAEPQPEWDMAKELWKEAWEIHIYFFGPAFMLLGMACVATIIRLWKMEHLLSKHYFLTLNVLVILVCFFRGLYLLVDAYNSRRIYPQILDYFLYSIVFPCLTSMFSILFYALLLATRVQALSKKVQKLWVLLAIIFFHFALSITTDIVIGFYTTAGLLLLICKFFFVLWGLLMFIGYILIFRRLYISAAHRHKIMAVHRAAEHKVNGVYSKNELKEHKSRYTLSLAIKVTFVSAFFGFACVGLELYGMFGVYGIMKQRTPEPWPWWTYQTLLRSMELLMCISIAYVAAQPLKYLYKKGQGHTFFYLLPCKLLFCDRDSAYRSGGGYSSNSLDHIHLSESSNESHSASRKCKFGNEKDFVDKARYEKTSLDALQIAGDCESFSRDATLPIRGRHKKSMLIVEDGFVRIRREDEMSSITEKELDTYSRSTDLNSGSLNQSNGHFQRSYDGSSENNISSCFPSNDEFSQIDHANGGEVLPFSWQIPFNHAAALNKSDIVLSISMSDLTNEMETELKKAFQSKPVSDVDLISNISLPVTLGCSTNSDHQCNVNFSREYHEENNTPQTSPSVDNSANNSSAISTSYLLISKHNADDTSIQKKLFDS